MPVTLHKITFYLVDTGNGEFDRLMGDLDHNTGVNKLIGRQIQKTSPKNWHDGHLLNRISVLKDHKALDEYLKGATPEDLFP